MSEPNEFFSRLQADLIDDHAHETTQAAPVYYGIIQTDSYSAPEYGNDGFTIWDHDAADEISPIDFVRREWENHEEWIYPGGGVDPDSMEYHGAEVDGDGRIIIEDPAELAQFVDEEIDGFSVTYYQEIASIRKNELFLTRADAEKHLRENRHHYLSNAHTYAMTSWRSPRYEQLLKLIEAIDWEKSELVMRNETRGDSHA